MKHLGRDSQNLEAVAAFMKDADIVTLQEVNIKNGQDALMRIASLLRAVNVNDRICIGLSFYDPKLTDSDERYGYIWKNSQISFIKSSGEAVENCENSAYTVPIVKKNAELIVREPSVGTFRSKFFGTNFKLVSIHLRPSGKKPQLEVPPLFEAVGEFQGPVIVAGDYNLDSGHSAFATAEAAGFKAVFFATKTSLKKNKRELNKPYDNIWFRNATLETKGEVINLYHAEELKDMEPIDIFNNISDHSPIVADFLLPLNVDGPAAKPANTVTPAQ